jgi:hypothetical protein
MNSNLIPDVLAIAFFVVPLFTAIRAFYIFGWARNYRLFTLGLSMTVIALTAADNLAMNTFTIPYNTYWFCISVKR